MAANGGQISISRETLRAELSELELRLTTSLAQLELRLIDRLADKGVVNSLTSRVLQIESNALFKGGPIADLAHDVDKRLIKLETWRAYLAGITALAVALAGLAVTLALHYISRRHT